MPTNVMFHPQATTVGTTVEEGTADVLTLEGFEGVFRMSGVSSETRIPSSDSSDACPLSGVRGNTGHVKNTFEAFQDHNIIRSLFDSRSDGGCLRVEHDIRRYVIHPVSI